MTDLIDTTEMYLRTILELEEENIVALRARIAERLRHSGPTVSQTVGRMERDGLVVVSGDRHLELGPGATLRLPDFAPVLGQRPSADVMFHSMARHAGRSGLGILLTLGKPPLLRKCL